MTRKAPSSEPPHASRIDGPPKKDRAFPSTSLFLFATFSLILPWIGVVLLLLGAARLAGLGAGAALANPGASISSGWLLIASGVACIVLDILIDVVWAHPSLSLTDEPTLNQPARDLIGRRAIVTESILYGRGKVGIAGSQWIAEGPDVREGESVRITGIRDLVLEVMPDETDDK